MIASLFLSSLQANTKQSILYEGLGFSPRKTILMAGIFQVILVVGGLLNLVLVDRLGRKPLFLGGFVILSIILGAFAACTARFATTGMASELHSETSDLSYPQLLTCSTF